jgi:hypothetical protein
MKLTDKTAKELKKSILESISSWVDDEFDNHREHNFSEEKAEEFYKYNLDKTMNAFSEDLDDLLTSDIPDEENYDEFQTLLKVKLEDDHGKVVDILKGLEAQVDVKAKKVFLLHQIFTGEDFKISGNEYGVVVATTKALTGKEEATTEEISSSITSKGYQFCPIEVTTQFLVHYSEILRGDDIRVIGKKFPSSRNDVKNDIFTYPIFNIDSSDARGPCILTEDVKDSSHVMWESRDWWLFVSDNTDS